MDFVNSSTQKTEVAASAAIAHPIKFKRTVVQSLPASGTLTMTAWATIAANDLFPKAAPSV
ncbi:hypothetical protein [Pseudanabaena sp. PCC 6802]|uniref:hypothetical protein n=1 Tax=Pseudanabaena sp. PCC 6802 TaxID=118173 RepID=UPI0012EA576E|nr:hypothetical protein [Pseudanabaena sp. PCC 6802]